MQWVLILPLLCLPKCCHFVELNYYWRDYFGTIPSDAVAAGQDYAGNNVYIGQGYIKNGGLQVGQINPDEKEVYVTFYNAYLVKYVKILCGPQENFFWINVNASNVYETLKDKPAILGGIDDILGEVRVARINVGGNTIVGRCTPAPNRVDSFHYVKGKDEAILTGAYQVLIYKDYKNVVGVL